MIRSVNVYRKPPGTDGQIPVSDYYLESIFTTCEGRVFYFPDLLMDTPYTSKQFIESFGDHFKAQVPNVGTVECSFEDGDKYLAHLKYRKNLFPGSDWSLSESEDSHMRDEYHYCRDSNGMIEASGDKPMMAWLFMNDPDKPDFTSFFEEHWRYFDGSTTHLQGLRSMLKDECDVPEKLLLRKGFEKVGGHWCFGGNST